MRNKKIILAIIFISILLSSCESENSKIQKNSNDKYLATYSGGYTIEILGYPSDNDVEAYALHENGSAKWMLIVNDRYGNAKIMSEKSGVWLADEGKIKVTIQGNTGPIVEEYVLKNGQFVNTLSEARYLKRTK
jgi:archaellum component FlaF (FlaF/FlaG flagellin family)